MDPANDTLAPPPDGLYLAMDYGEKYIGVASGHSLTGTASPLTVIHNHCGTPDWQQLEHLLTEWQPVAFVVGLPLQMDGSEQPLTQHVKGYARQLKKRFALPVYTVDERMTTREAGSIIRNNRSQGKRRKTNKADRDKIAAALILEKWFKTSI